MDPREERAVAPLREPALPDVAAGRRRSECATQDDSLCLEGEKGIFDVARPELEQAAE